MNPPTLSHIKELAFQATKFSDSRELKGNGKLPTPMGSQPKPESCSVQRCYVTQRKTTLPKNVSTLKVAARNPVLQQLNISQKKEAKMKVKKIFNHKELCENELGIPHTDGELDTFYMEMKE